MVYRRHTSALYGLVLRLLAHRRDDAEDVVQEAWIRAAERLDRFRWDASLRTWLSSNFWRDYNTMRDAGVRFVRAPKDASYGTVTVFEDLYGNLWGLVQLSSQVAVKER